MISILIIWPPKIEYIFSIQKHFASFGETVAYLDQITDFNVDVMDGSALQYFQWDFIEAYSRQYDFLVIYTDLHNSISSIDAAKQCKDISTDTVTIAYGRGVHYAPEVFLENGFDAAVIDPMYQTAIEKYIRYKTENSDLSELKGIYFREGNHTIQIDDKYEFDISKIAFPALGKLPIEQYKNISGRDQLCFTVAKGCSYNCRFCRVPLGEGRSIFHRRVDDIVEYTESVKDGFSSVKLLAPTFTAERVWVMELCEAILKADLKFKWIVTTRLELLDAEMLEMMSKAGCIAIAFGIETLYVETQSRIDKYLPREFMIKQFRLIHSAQIIPKAFVMLGIPGQTTTEIEEMYMLLKANRVEIRPKEYYPYELMLTNSNKLDMLRFFERNSVYKTRISDVSTLQFVKWLADRTAIR